ncbi:MAG: hypothetical protein ACJ763_09445 [Bdellovibrionia bacterium]
MKTLMTIGTLLTLSSAAYAAPVTCTTNISHDVRQPSTTFTIDTNPQRQTYVTMQTRGGLAQFITAPHTFFVSVQSRGPEAVEYFNAKEDFELMVVYQPINGQIHGMYTGDIMGRRVQAPVICVVAMPSYR